MVATRPSARKRVGNLPADTTSFLGRRREIAEVKRLLSASRLVTLTGPGGVGKTRLALRAAADVRRAFHSRVWLVELAELRDPALLANTVAEQLGLHDQSARDPIDTIVDHLSAGPLLLVLDNCEQLVEECATFAGTLIRACPELLVLATSRQSLGLLGETTFPVAPFPIPDPDHIRSPASIAHFESVQLFVERASAVVPGFAVTEDNCAALARICHDLDGIPLAIELTAVRLRALSLEQITQRLSERYRLLSGGSRGAPPRQRTLRALIDWSYDLCSDQERLVWARVSVFSGSFDLAAAERVGSDDGIEPDDMLDIVDSLVDKSILIREEAERAVRFRMLQTMREYGEEKLVAAGELPALRRRHRDWFSEIAARFDAEWIGPDQLAWIGVLRRGHADLRIALSFCATEPGEAAVGLRMVAQLDDYWGVRGFHTEARHWIDRLLTGAPRTAPAYRSALRMGGWFALLQGDLTTGLSLLADATKLAEESGDVAERAYLTHGSGMAALFAGELDRAAALFDESLSRFRAAGVLRGELFTLFIFGLTVGLGERERGLALLDECIAATLRLGDGYWRSYALWAVATVEVRHGDPDHAEVAAKDALRLQRVLPNRLAIAFTTDTLAWIAERREQHARAASLFGAADALWHEIGASPAFYRTFADEHDNYLALARSALGDDGFEMACQQGRRLPTDLAVDFALETRRTPDVRKPDSAVRTSLTRREEEIAGLVTEGMTNRDIAAQLVISPRTVEAHVEHILVKLGFTSRTQIATWVAAQRTSATADTDTIPRVEDSE